jgi:hypothetical protein
VPRVSPEAENPVIDTRAERAGKGDLHTAAVVQQKSSLLIGTERLAIQPGARCRVQLKTGEPHGLRKDVARGCSKRRHEKRVICFAARVLELESNDHQAYANGEAAYERSAAACGVAPVKQRGIGARRIGNTHKTDGEHRSGDRKAKSHGV